MRCAWFDWWRRRWKYWKENVGEDKTSNEKRSLPLTDKCKTKYYAGWETDFPLKAVKDNIYILHCVPCRKSLSCDHQGLADVKVNCKPDSHKVSLEPRNK